MTKKNLKINISSGKGKKLVWALVCIMLFLASLVVGNNSIKFGICTGTLIVIVAFAKCSYFSAFSFVLWYSFLQEYFASINILFATGGLRYSTSIPVYFDELYICTMYFMIFELVLFIVTDVLNRERILYKIQIDISNNMAILYSFGAFFLVVLSYPSLPSLNASLSRNEGIVSSALFVPIALLILASTFSNIKKSKVVLSMWILTVFWILFHGERVIVFGLFIYIILKYINNDEYDKTKIKNSIKKHKKILIVGIFMILAVVLGIKIQSTRTGGEFDVSNLYYAILKQGTAADVTYVFNCATDMWKTGEGLNGLTYLQYITCWIPFLDNNYAPAVILMQKYKTLGGGLFFAEPMMNNGMIGVFIYTALFLILITCVFYKSSEYRAYFVIPFIILIFRFTWYASLAGWVTLSIYVVPVLYYIAKKVR